MKKLLPPEQIYAFIISFYLILEQVPVIDGKTNNYNRDLLKCD